MHDIDPVSGKPFDKSYLECDLPESIAELIDRLTRDEEALSRGVKYTDWDCDYCELQSEINCAEVDQVISSEQAWYLREKYLKIRRWDL